MFLLLSIFLAISFIPYVNHHLIIANIDNVKSSLDDVEISKYVNLTGRRIYINDGWDDVWPYNTYSYLEASDKTTWAELAAKEDWCRGSGTLLDPYVIENIYIDCQKMGPGISIFLSNVHFIIRNCYIINSGLEDYDTGISLVHVRNGQIINNIFVNIYNAIWLVWSSDNVISLNKMIHDTSTSGLINVGKVIKVEWSSHNTISYNSALDYYDGIYLWESDYHIIHGNYLETNIFGHFPDTGLCLTDSNYNRISYNMFGGDYAKYPNRYGDFIINEQNCIGNTNKNNFNVPEGYSPIMLSIYTSWLSLLNGIPNCIFSNYLFIESNQSILLIISYFIIGFFGIIKVRALNLISFGRKIGNKGNKRTNKLY